MNDFAQAILLGAVQGLTEFLPVSSSGHLVLAQQALGEQFQFAESAVIFDLVLHAGTLLPVLWFYRADLIRMILALIPGAQAGGGQSPVAPSGATSQEQVEQDRKLALYVVLATIPTGLIGVLFKDTFEELFHNVSAVCAALLTTGALLLSTRRRGEVLENTPAASNGLSAGKALLIGLVQGMAITPGISRSGSTIATALLLGVPREEAARFSFLMSIPAICGAIVFMLKDGAELAGMPIGLLFAGFLTALVVGYASLVMLVMLVRRGGLYRFAYYVIPVAVASWIFLR